MTDSKSLTGIFIFIGILLFALWIGISIVTNQIETVLYISAGITLLTCALLGRKIWMIIPFAMAVNLTLKISGQPTTLLLAEILFCGFCFLLFLIRRLRLNINYSELDIWTLLLTACVIQAYLRNPVGLNIFGGASIGARPYAIFAITLVTSLILTYIKIPVKELKWLLQFHILGGLLNFLTLSIGYFIPSIGMWYGATAIGSDNKNTIQEGQYGVVTATRIGFLGEFARNLSLWISAFISPLRACFHPLWSPLVLLSIVFAALSGFRNEIAAIGFTYLIGIAYRGGIASIMITGVTLILGVSFLAIINLTIPLPPNIQRSLSFLPGTWEESYKADAESSTQWRVEMWKEALLTDYWIENKILGDGLGMTREELNYINSFGVGFTAAQSISKSRTLTLQQEFMMASNNYHSGPVSLIRTIGYVGLSVLLIAQIRLAVHAHRQIKRSKNTEWMPISLLVGIPIIWAPIYFVFINGDFGTSITAYLLGVAFVRILENNLPLPAYSKHGRIHPPVGREISSPAEH